MKRLCLEPACPNTATYRGRCRGHQRQRNRETSPNQAIYNRKKWKLTRKRYLFRHPICERDCQEIATDVHHKQAIQDGGDPWSMDNLEALCHSHHSMETRQEQMA
jgi:5-methylcytosine-specific restriction enzyme A